MIVDHVPVKRRWTERKGKTFFVGLVTNFILASIFMGGPEDVMQVLAIAVICTAGVSLLVIIPVCFVVGNITLAVIGWIRKFHEAEVERSKNKVQNKEKKKQINIWSKEISTGDLSLITAYVAKARGLGYADDKIKEALREAGWKDEEIAKGM